MPGQAGPAALNAVLALILQKPVRGCTTGKSYQTLLRWRSKTLTQPNATKGHVFAPLDMMLRGNEFVRDWIRQERMFVSPKTWPSSILPAFRYSLVPTPRELGSIHFRHHLPTNHKDVIDGYAATMAYCYGLDMDKLSKHLDVALDIFHERMRYFITYMAYERPSFLVWATATDFDRSPLPASWYNLVGGEREARPRLQDSPFVFRPQDLAPWTDSSKILGHLIFNTRKKPRLLTHRRDTHLIEGYDGP